VRDDVVAYVLDEAMAMVAMIADRRVREGRHPLPDGATFTTDADYADDEAEWTPPPPPEWLTGRAA
jgi:hypothetical protein